MGECLLCCRKCKGLFPIEQDVVKHIQSCCGSPFKSPCLLFACERKLFLQLFALDDFPQKNVSITFTGVEEEMQVQAVSQPETTQQSLFMTGSQQVGSQPVDNGSQYLQGNGGINLQHDSTVQPLFLTGSQHIGSQPTVSQSQYLQGNSGISPQHANTEQPLFLSGSQQIGSHPLDDQRHFLPGNGIESQQENEEQQLLLSESQPIGSQSRVDQTHYMHGSSEVSSHCETQSQFMSESRSASQPQNDLFINKNGEMTSSDAASDNVLVTDPFFSNKMAETIPSISGLESQPSLMQQPITEECSTTVIKPKYLNDSNEDKVKSAIARNLKYLQDTNLTRIPSPIEKQLGLFCDSRLTYPRLQSPLEKQFQARVQSPVDKAINFLGEPGSSVQPLSGSSNPALPFSCNLGGTDLLGNLTTQDDNPMGLPSIEEFPTLQYLDLAKKDPFWGQNIGLTQINTKDPFLINASEPSEKLTSQKITAVEKSAEDINIHSSPTLQLQDGNYFNFASTLDEPTQLDYLDLATLDFLTNPNLGSYPGLGPWRPDRYPSDKEDNIYPGDLMSTEYNSFVGESAASYTLSHSMSSEDLFTHSLHGRSGEIGKNKSLFKPVSKPGSRSKAMSKRTKAQSLRKKLTKGVEKVRKEADTDISGEPSSKVQRVEDNDKTKQMAKSNIIQTELNVKEHLEGFTEAEKDSFKAVLGPNRSIVVKKIKLQHPPHNEPEVIEENAEFKVEKVADRTVFNCKMCSYTSTKIENMERHQEDHTVKVTLQCPECSYSCAQARALKAHFESQHSKLKHQICEVCGEILKDKGKLQNHMTKHTGEHRFECSQCDYKTNIKLSYTDHMKKHAGIYLSCDKEGCEFKTFYHRVLVQHKKKHDGLKQLVCDYCSYSTAEAVSLKRHIQLQHLKEHNFKCLKCNYYSVNKHDVIIHVRNKHFQIKPYQCNQCEFKTGYANGLKLHLMQHAGIRPYKCSACSYHVNKSDVIKRHIKTVHADEPGVTVEKIDLPYTLDSKKFKCEDADKSDKELEKYIIELTGKEKKLKTEGNKVKLPKEKDKMEENKGSETNENKGTKMKLNKLKLDTSSVERTSLLNSIIDISDMTGKRKVVSLLPKDIDSVKGKVSLTKSKSSYDIPSSVSSLIKTITIPAGSSDDEITTFQCSFCLCMFTSVYEIVEHIVKCKNDQKS